MKLSFEIFYHACLMPYDLETEALTNSVRYT